MEPASPPTAAELAAWLRRRLDEPATLKHAPHGPQTPVRRLALALDWRDVPAGVCSDAVFIHRDRGAAAHLPELTLLGSHDGFDLHLTTGPNSALAQALGWQEVQEVRDEAGTLRGLSAVPPQSSFTALRARLEAEFGPAEFAWEPAQTEAGRFPPLRVALMNATRPALVRQAAAQGVNVYLTGEMRRSALSSLEECGVGILALGHRPTEEWGLRQLARELQGAFTGLQTEVLAAGAQP